MLNQVLTSLLHTRDSIADAAAALKLPLSEFVAIATSPRAQEILAQVEALEKRRAEVLQAVALAAALQTLHALTDADSLGDDDTRNIQRKSAVAILTHTRATARLSLDAKRAESLALLRAQQSQRRAKDRSPLPDGAVPEVTFRGGGSTLRAGHRASATRRRPTPQVAPSAILARRTTRTCALQCLPRRPDCFQIDARSIVPRHAMLACGALRSPKPRRVHAPARSPPTIGRPSPIKPRQAPPQE